MDEWTADPDFQDWLNELLANAGDEWDTDEAMTSIALRYVRHLEERQARTIDELVSWLLPLRLHLIEQGDVDGMALLWTLIEERHHD